MYDHIKRIIIGITVGIIVGSLIGSMSYYGIIPREFRESTTYITIKICIGLIILIVDLFCIWGLVKPDEWSRPSHFACVVYYNTDKGKITKEFPPTPLTSERELYPFSLEEGNEIPIKHLKNHPKLSIINNDTLKAAYKAEHTNDMIHLVMIPIISTALYILALIML